MSAVAMDIASMVDILPDKERDFAREVVRRLVLAWDPDFTKLTPNEAAELEEARREIDDGAFYRHDEIDWENLDKLDI